MCLSFKADNSAVKLCGVFFWKKMRFDVVRCMLFICCVAVLAGVSECRNISKLRRPLIPIFPSPNEECGMVNPSAGGKTKPKDRPKIKRLREFKGEPKFDHLGPKVHSGILNSNFSNITCSKASWSCEQRSCPDHFSSTHDKYSCFCDSYCELFQDCCYDYPTACNKTERKENGTKVQDDLLLSLSCVSLSGVSYRMKSNCSKSWPNNEIASLCTDLPPLLNSSTYMDFFPVSGLDNITYRNRHCAQCNHQNTFEFWMLKTSLRFQPATIQSTDDLIDFVVERKKSSTYSIVPPKNDMPLRYCRKPISKCKFNLSEEASACSQGGVALVFKARGNTLYKNKHCAFCNEINDLSCKPDLSSKSQLKVSDFYLTINFKHKSQSSGFSINPVCPKKIYDHHLKACVNSKDIAPPIDMPLDRYRVAVWFVWLYSVCSLPNITYFTKCLIDVEPSNIFNATFEMVQQDIRMIKFDVQLTLNQSIELLGDYSEVGQNSTTAHSILKFLKPFIRPFFLRLGSRTVKVIKTSSRRLGCVGLQVYNPSDYTKIDRFSKIYVHKTKRNYTREQYFEDDSSNGVIKVCEKQLPTGCDGFYHKFLRSEFEVRTNLSLYHKLKGVLYRFGQYTIEDNNVYICDKALGFNMNVTRQYLTLIGLCLSLFCLLITLVTYITLSELQTGPGKNIINLTIALVLLDVIWLVSPQAVQIRSACITTAFGIQYFMLVAHISMAKVAHDTLCMFADPIVYQRKVSADTAHQAKMFIIVWLIPLGFVVMCFLLYHFNAVLDIQYTEICWLSGPHIFAIVHIPICLIIAFNILCFTLSILKMRKLEKNGQMLRAQRQEKSSVFIYIKISTVLGLGWASSFIAMIFPVFSYLFVVLTTFQGVYIFLAFVCKRSVLTLYTNAVCRRKRRKDTALPRCENKTCTL